MIFKKSAEWPQIIGFWKKSWVIDFRKSWVKSITQDCLQNLIMYGHSADFLAIIDFFTFFLAQPRKIPGLMANTYLTEFSIFLLSLFFGLLGISYFPLAYVVNKWFIPEIRRRQVVSSFEFLRERFSPLLSRCAVGIYLIQSLLYLAVTLYTPTLALTPFFR